MCYDDPGQVWLFLWSENDYKIKDWRTKAQIALEGIFQCTSPDLTDILNEVPEFVCSIVVSGAEEDVGPNSVMETFEDRWSIPNATKTARFLIHGLDDDFEFNDIHDLEYLEFGIGDKGKAVILLNDWENIQTRECPFRHAGCSPWAEPSVTGNKL